VPKDELVTIDDFSKIRLKVAEVTEASAVPKSEKLLKLKIHLDGEERQIISGIAKSYTPEEMVGKKVLIVANLKPAKIFGHESHVCC
jgi:methionyl-tRNA synthetase